MAICRHNKVVRNEVDLRGEKKDCPASSLLDGRRGIGLRGIMRSLCFFRP